MVNNNIFLDHGPETPDGWHDWALIKNLPENWEANLLSVNQKTDYAFPLNSLPAKAFWMESIVASCLGTWEWTLPEEADSSDIEDYDCYSERNGNITIKGLGRGYNDISNAPPRMGYVIGDVFKQHVYIKREFEQKVESDPECEDEVVKLYITSSAEVMQNSRYKRIYVKQGIITNYIRDGLEGDITHTITLDLDDEITSTTFPEGIDLEGDTIDVKGSGGSSFTLTIKSVLSNWDIEVSLEDPSNVINVGDYYEFQEPWCIRDPYLMSGFWMGSETESVANGNFYPVSGDDLYLTTHNRPYREGTICGVYVWETSSGVEFVANTIGIESCGSGEWRWLTFYENPDFDNPPYEHCTNRFNQDLVTAENSAKRGYNGEVIPPPESDSKFGTYITYVRRSNTTEANFEEFKSLSNYVRIDISTQGKDDNYNTMHNWFADCLTNNYILSAGKYYRILSNPANGIIDVQITSVDGSGSFDPINNVEYSILNQRSWMINEHYDGFPPGECVAEGGVGEWGDSDGLFKGAISSSSYDADTNETTIVLSVYGDHCAEWLKNYDSTPDFPAERGDEPWASNQDLMYNESNNFVNRYRRERLHGDGEPVKLYTKFNGWRFVTSSEERWMNTNVKGYEIKSIDFGEVQYPASFNPYSISMVVGGKVSSIPTEGYIIFGELFETACWSPENVLFYSDYGCSQSICEGITPDGSDESSSSSSAEDGCPTCGDLDSEGKICYDGGFMSNQYLISIASNKRMSFTEGFGFGTDQCGAMGYDLDYDGSYVPKSLCHAHISTADGSTAIDTAINAAVLGISGVFDTMAEQDWILYRDINTEKVTIRSADLNYKDQTVKSEILIGPVNRKIVEGEGIIPLDPDQGDRVYKLSFTVPEGSASEMITIRLNGEEAIYGVPVSGIGDVDLQGLRLQGYAEGSVPSSTYVDSNSNAVSPVYVYPLSSRQHASNLKIGFGVSTTQKNGEPTTISFDSDGIVRNIEAEYVNEADIIDGNSGLFDIFRTTDGSFLLIYSKDIGEFEITRPNGTTSHENSASAGNEWTRKKAVMMIKTDDLGDNTWNAPFLDDQIKPLMLINGVDYLSSVYDAQNERLLIFVKCYNVAPDTDGDNSSSSSADDGCQQGNAYLGGYVGCFTINLFKTADNVLPCSPISS